MSENTKKPNIVVFFTDQQRADTCGCYGQPLNITPNLDRFAKEGVVFEHAYTCQPVCGPARAAIQSGLYPTATGCFVNGVALPEDTDTIAKELNKTGYRTGYVGKWHLASDNGKKEHYERKAVPEARRGGYKDYFTASDVLEFTSTGKKGFVFSKDGKKLRFRGYRADKITDHALDFLSRQNKDNPFFLFLSHIEPHHQNTHFRFEGPRGSKKKFCNFTPPADLAGEKGDWRKSYPDYLGCVESLDQNFGRVLCLLEEKGLAENTVVIFTSDHGCHFRTRNPEYKRSCHDASIRIPFVVRGKGFPKGAREDSIVSLIDLPRTILSIAGIDRKDYHGNDLRRIADGTLDPECAFVQISEDHIGRAIRTKRFTYEVTDKGSGYKTAAAETYYDAYLYDNQKDPAQKNNLIYSAEYRTEKEELRALLKKKIKEFEHADAEIRDGE